MAIKDNPEYKIENAVEEPIYPKIFCHRGAYTPHNSMKAFKKVMKTFLALCRH